MIECDLQRKLYEKVTRNIQQSYDKMYDSSLAVERQHQAWME